MADDSQTPAQARRKRTADDILKAHGLELPDPLEEPPFNPFSRHTGELKKQPRGISAPASIFAPDGEHLGRVGRPARPIEAIVEIDTYTFWINGEAAFESMHDPHIDEIERAVDPFRSRAYPLTLRYRDVRDLPVAPTRTTHEYVSKRDRAIPKRAYLDVIRRQPGITTSEIVTLVHGPNQDRLAYLALTRRVRLALAGMAELRYVRCDREPDTYDLRVQHWTALVDPDAVPLARPKLGTALPPPKNALPIRLTIEGETMVHGFEEDFHELTNELALVIQHYDMQLVSIRNSDVMMDEPMPRTRQWRHHPNQGRITFRNALHWLADIRSGALDGTHTPALCRFDRWALVCYRPPVPNDSVAYVPGGSNVEPTRSEMAYMEVKARVMLGRLMARGLVDRRIGPDGHALLFLAGDAEARRFPPG